MAGRCRLTALQPPVDGYRFDVLDHMTENGFSNGDRITQLLKLVVYGLDQKLLAEMKGSLGTASLDVHW